MLFEGLSKLKRQSVMASIVLLAIGIVLIICPDRYIGTLINVLGIVMLLAACTIFLDFISSEKSLMDFVRMTCALVLGIAGGVVLILETHTIYVLAWLFGIALIVYGVYSLFHAQVFARRSGRKGWWIMVLLSALLIFFGVIIIIHPYWNTPGALLRIIGWVVVYSAIVSALRLIWIWPIKNA